MLGIRFVKKLMKRVRARKLHKKKDLVSYEELIGKLVRLHDSLFIVNGDLVIQKSVGTETRNIITKKRIIRK